MEDLVASGRIDSASVTVIAGNRVVVVVPSDRIPVIRTIEDLTAPGIRRIALPDTMAPIGRYATAFLRHHDLLGKINDRIVRTENARASLAATASGAVDLSFVYATDARTTDRVRVVWEVAADSIPPVRVVVGLVRERGDSSRARDFLKFLQSEEAAQAWRAAGFLPPD
jgi:molybdate transport system substrate-binding protein